MVLIHGLVPVRRFFEALVPDLRRTHRVLVPVACRPPSAERSYTIAESIKEDLAPTLASVRVLSAKRAEAVDAIRMDGTGSFSLVQPPTLVIRRAVDP